MATAEPQPHTITDKEVELLSFLRQNIVWKLCQESAKQGRHQTDPGSSRQWPGISTWARPPPPHGAWGQKQPCPGNCKFLLRWVCGSWHPTSVAQHVLHLNSCNRFHCPWWSKHGMHKRNGANFVVPRNRRGQLSVVRPLWSDMNWEPPMAYLKSGQCEPHNEHMMEELDHDIDDPKAQWL